MLSSAVVPRLGVWAAAHCQRTVLMHVISTMPLVNTFKLRPCFVTTNLRIAVTFATHVANPTVSAVQACLCNVISLSAHECQSTPEARERLPNANRG